MPARPVAECVDVGAEDIPDMAMAASENEFVVIGPDAPLSRHGDGFTAPAKSVRPPSGGPARSSKSFTKAISRQQHPGLGSENFTDVTKAEDTS